MERCLEEFKGVLTGALPTVDCLKFGVSKGLVRRDTERRGSVRAVLRDDELTSQPPFSFLFFLCVSDADEAVRVKGFARFFVLPPQPLRALLPPPRSEKGA